MGIVEEGEEVMAEGKKKDETAADLALIGAAQKEEHYEKSRIVGIGKGGVFPGLPEIGGTGRHA